MNFFSPMFAGKPKRKFFQSMFASPTKKKTTYSTWKAVICLNSKCEQYKQTWSGSFNETHNYCCCCGKKISRIIMRENNKTKERSYILDTRYKKK